MPPSRNNTVKFTDLQAISSVNIGDIIPVVDTSVPTLVNKKINVQDFSRSLPVSQQVAQVGAVSGNWNSVYTTTAENSASWSTGGTYGTAYNQNSAEYESVYVSVLANSGSWNSVYSNVQTNSAAWTGLTTFTTVNSLSNNWNSGYTLANSAYTTLSTLSTGYWVLKSGDLMTGALTTTRNVTANFTIDELVTKRYVDAMAVATQISGNFVPSLYYTKADFSTGVPLVCATNLQTYGFALGAAGASQTGTLSFDPNQYGTSVTGFTLGSTNNRTGLRIIAGAYNRFNASEQGLSYVWGGPTFQQNIFTLGDNGGTNVMAVDHYGPYHAAPLTNSVVLRCTSPLNFFINNYSTVSIAPKWDNAATTFTGVSISAIDAGSTTSSNLLDLQTNGISQLVVRKDGLMQSRSSTYDAVKVSGLANRSSSTGAILTFINPFDGTVGLASTSMVQWGDPGSGTPYNNQGDVLVTRDEAGVLSLRPNTVNAGPQSVRVYRRYVNNTTNFERFGLSGNRIAYELSGSQRFFIGATANSDIEIAATGNLSLSAGGSLSFSQSLPTSFAGLQANAPASNTSSHFRVLSSNGKTLFNISSAGRVAIRGRSTSISDSSMESPTYDLECIGFTQPILFRHLGSNTGFIVDEFGHGLNSDVAGCWLGASGTGARVQLWGGGPLNGVAIGSGTTGFLNVYNNGKVAIGRNSIYASSLTSPLCAQVAIVNDSTMNSYTTDILALSSGPGTPLSFTQFFTRFYNVADGTSILSVRRDGFTVLGVGGLGRVFLYEGSNLGIDLDPTNPTGNLGLASYMHFGWSSSIAANGTKDISLFRAGAGRLEQRASTTAQNYSIYNTYTDGNNYERLSLSATRIAYEYAGTGVVRDLTISTAGNLILSGASISFNTATPYSFGTSQLSANRISINYAGGFQTTNFLACESPDGYVIGTNNSGGSYSFVSVNNYAANNGNAALASARGQWNFPSVVNAPTAFTLNNQIYLLNDTATTQLIGVSSNRASAGFYFYPKGLYPQPASIFLDFDSNLNIYFAGGGGKSLVLGDGTNNPLVLRYPSNGSIATGDWSFNTFNTTTNNVTINQRVNHVGTLFRVLSTNSTAMFSVSADGVSRFNNKVFIKPTGLIQFTNETSTTPAIKGTSNTIQARTGDDSQYTYLQGKLQTDQAANAGTFTPDKYLILYDSTGTAYKVPVQAL